MTDLGGRQKKKKKNDSPVKIIIYNYRRSLSLFFKLKKKVLYW